MGERMVDAMFKKWVIPVICVIVAAVAVGAALICLGQKDGPGRDPAMAGDSEGRYIRTENGMDIILLDGSPVVMSGEETLFEGLNTGDLIRIRHGLIRETYPGGTDVYSCERVEAGSLEDIPQDILESICPMGYVPVDSQGTTKAVYTGTVLSSGEDSFRLRLSDICEQELDIQLTSDTVCVLREELTEGDSVRVECGKDSSGVLTAETVTELLDVRYEYSFANMGLTLDADWDYEILPYNEDEWAFGIAFWPLGQEGRVKVLFYPDGNFGVCGTGLYSESISWSMGLEARLNRYDTQKYWSFISFDELPGTYIILTEGVSGWSKAQMDRAMEFLKDGSLADGILWKNAVMEYAKRDCGGEAYVWRANFDPCTGYWSVGLQDGQTRYTLLYSAEGELLDKQESSEVIVVPEKPVIYLYSEQETLVTVELFFEGKLTATYPKYEDGWKVIARPDGTLTDPVTGREYYCLFWEGIANTEYDFSRGFVVAGVDTAAFLEDALGKLGLTDRETNEFIIYWAPRMEGNAYNLISFQQEAYTASAVLNIDPTPDTLIRVFMAWKALEEPIDIEPQELTAPERKGFTVVEWGGAEVAQ